MSKCLVYTKCFRIGSPCYIHRTAHNKYITISPVCVCRAWTQFSYTYKYILFKKPCMCIQYLQTSMKSSPDIYVRIFVVVYSYHKTFNGFGAPYLEHLHSHDREHELEQGRYQQNVADRFDCNDHALNNVL